MDLKNKQRKLKLNLREYDLNSEWFSHPLIGQLRKRINELMPEGLFDPQDLEHQTLFRLTTYDPSFIDDDLIRHTIEEQLLIIEDRLKDIEFDLPYLFRGLSNKYKDLNCKNRLTIHSRDGRIFAENKHWSFEVEFKKVEDEKIINLFTNQLHYIHNERSLGEAFGLFFKGDDIPWAIETTEPSVISKNYKREALLANGIDPNKAIELTRLYMLPGSPKNAISILDSKMAKHYKEKGIEALFTTTMPMYSKTKGATIAGGLNKVLLIKELEHKFAPIKIKGNTCYKMVTNSELRKKNIEYLATDPNFPTLFTVETFLPINSLSLNPLPELKDKVIYLDIHRKPVEEKELKYEIENVEETLEKIRNICKYRNIEYIKDTIWGNKSTKKKIRFRVFDFFTHRKIEVTHKRKVDNKKTYKTEVEEYLYSGNSQEEAVKVIKKHGSYSPENSYEKIRVNYIHDSSTVSLDIYPFGKFVEIEGDEKSILETSNSLGFDNSKSIKLNADESYLKWNKELKLKELWHVRFGLTDKLEAKKKN